jgi:hypothetical protein
MWTPGPDRDSPLSQSAPGHQSQKGDLTPRRRFLKKLGGGLLILIILAAIGNFIPKSHSQPITPNSSVSNARPVIVTVVKSGFTQSTNSVDLISYGLVLRNESLSRAALDVKVTTTLEDSLGRSVGTSDVTITGIARAGMFDVGGSIAPNISLRVSRLHVTIKVGGSTTEQLVLPPVSNVTIKIRQFGNGSVAGSFRNPYSKFLPSDATIFIVYMNAQGQILGGDSEQTGAAVSPGATVAFSDSILSMTLHKTTIVHASVDPDGFPTPGSGIIRWTTS